MTITFAVVNVDGDVEVVTRASLEVGDLQELVGGYIEAVTLSGDCVMYINEEGKLHGLAPNVVASRLAHADRAISERDRIVGTALVMGADEHGNETSIPESMLDWIAAVAST